MGLLFSGTCEKTASYEALRPADSLEETVKNALTGAAVGFGAEAALGPVLRGLTKKSKGAVSDTNSISRFYDDALEKAGPPRQLSLGRVSSNQTARIKKATGIDLSGYERTISDQSIRHVAKRHGDDALPIGKDDFNILQDVFSSPDKISKSRTKQGLDAILYEKRINGSIYYVEEVRTGKKVVSLKTMYKSKAGAETEPLGLRPERSPELTGAPHAPGSAPDSNIPPYAQSVNLSRLNTEDDVKGLLAFMSKEKKAEPWSVTVQKAKSLGLDADEIIKNEKVPIDELASRVEAVRQVSLNTVSDLSSALKSIPDDPAQRTPAMLAEFGEKLKKANGVFQVTNDYASNIGRALNIHKRALTPEKAAFRAL